MTRLVLGARHRRPRSVANAVAATLAGCLAAGLLAGCASTTADGAGTPGVAITGSGADGTAGSGAVGSGAGSSVAAPGATDGAGQAGSPSPVPLPTDFRADATPRPIVLTGPAVLDPVNGFGTGDQKMAYATGSFALRVTLPVTSVTPAGRTVISAAAALTSLRPANAATEPAVQPLAVVGVTLTEASFSTDRGPRTLPAWQFRFDGVAGPALVLAVPDAALWQGRNSGGYGSSGSSAKLSDGGRTIAFSFVGTPAGPSPCGESYRAVTQEAANYVVIDVAEIKPNPLGSTSTETCPALAQERTVTATLQTPLGNRVLVDSRNQPVTVT